MTAFARRPRHSVNIWPGFVDALAALLMVVIFLLMVFVVSQFYLRETLSNRETALEELGSQISELAELLSLERQTNEDLRLSVEQLSAELQNSIQDRDQLSSRTTELEAALRESQSVSKTAEKDLSEARFRISDLESRLAEEQARMAESMGNLAEKEKALSALGSRFKASEESLLEERKLTSRQKDELDLLNQQIAALRQQMAAIQEALEASERKDKENKVKISDLGKRLNVALAGKVQELARYRSEFFGRLREVLGNHPDISIVGDRFVFQSEVLFDSGSAELGPEGQIQLGQLAATLKSIAEEIPADIDWILRIDGHTDPVPISNFRYHNNWELSAGRAISVVRFLISQGIPASRLAAAGFGEFYPLDPKKDDVANRRNRRIEIKLTQR